MKGILLGGNFHASFIFRIHIHCFHHLFKLHMPHWPLV
uniref:Uncharacterized protein n=1 Tax=Rhizophora mucronata TaxID=61149 RepID=A0A2P2LQY9_RHIMU